MVALSLVGCSLLPPAAPQPPSGIDLTKGAYAVIYTDSISREAGVSTLGADGTLVSSAKMAALGLHARAQTPDRIILIGARAADMAVVERDGSIHTAQIAYPDGTGATATTFIDDEHLATLINVGNTTEGYQNPIVIHDLSGRVLRSHPLQGYFTSIIRVGDKLLATGQISHPDSAEDGSRAVLLDPNSLEVQRTWDWPANGGLDQCVALDRSAICLETEGFKDGARTHLANHLVRLDPSTGAKAEITTFTEDCITLLNQAGRIVVATAGAIHLLAPDLTRIERHLPLTSGKEAIETLTAGGAGLDVFIRDYDRTTTADGRADIGHIVRLDPRTLQIVRQTPMQLPNQQLVGVHLIANEFFHA